MREHEDQFVGAPFTWFIGEVRSISDPLNMNRVKVFPYGYYDDERVQDSDLPWSTVMMSNAHASLKGNGGNHHLEVGSWVVGFFRDGYSAQDAIILGSIPTQTDGVIDIPPESSETNKVYKSKAGHLIELDNTTGEERVHIKHAKGSSILIEKDGTIKIDAFNDVILVDGDTKITGKLDVTGEVKAKCDSASESVTLTGHTHSQTGGTETDADADVDTGAPTGGT